MTYTKLKLLHIDTMEIFHREKKKLLQQFLVFSLYLKIFFFPTNENIYSRLSNVCGFLYYFSLCKILCLILLLLDLLYSLVSTHFFFCLENGLQPFQETILFPFSFSPVYYKGASNNNCDEVKFTQLVANRKKKKNSISLQEKIVDFSI